MIKKGKFFTNDWGSRYDRGIRGGTRKIKDAELPCLHPGHNPPSHMVYEPGTYEHTCPGCGRKIVFRAPLITC